MTSRAKLVNHVAYYIMNNHSYEKLYSRWVDVVDHVLDDTSYGKDFDSGGYNPARFASSVKKIVDEAR